LNKALDIQSSNQEAGFYRSYEEKKMIDSALESKRKELLQNIKALTELPKIKRYDTIADSNPEKEKVK